MKKGFLILSMFIMLVVIVAACGGAETDSTSGSNGDTEDAETITVKHDLGEATVTENPEKIVVFDFGVLDSLDKLGIEVTGVPQASNIPSYLSKYEDSKYENVGGLKEPDFEKIAEIDPDVIFISGRQSEVYEDLNELAPTIFMGVDTENYMESYKANAEKLGEIFNKEEEVEKELSAVENAIDALHTTATDSGNNALIILANEGNISAYGPGSRFGLVHDVFGIEAVDDTLEVSTHGQNVSFEYVVEMDPDYLFVIDRGAAVNGESSAKQLIENTLTEKTKAYKNDNIVYLNADYWYLSGGGLVSVAEMVNEIEAAIAE